MRLLCAVVSLAMLTSCVDDLALSPQCEQVADAWCSYLDSCGAIPSDNGTPSDTSDDYDDVDACRAALFGSCQDTGSDETVCLSEIEAVSRINLTCTSTGDATPSADPPGACTPWF